MKGRGLAFVIVLAFVLILAIAACAFIALSSSEIRMVKLQRDSTKAFYIAEAGLEYAHKGLKENWDGYTTGLPRYGVFSQCFEDGCFSVDIEDDPLPDTIRVISKGTVGVAERTLQEIIRGTVGGGIPGFDFAALALGNLFLEGSGSIENQDVYVNGNLEVHSPYAVKGGDVYAKGNVTLMEVASITGNVNANGNIVVNAGTTIDGGATAKGGVTNEGTITGTVTSYAFPAPVDEAALQAKAESYRLSSEDWDNYKLAAQGEGNYREGTFYPSGSYTGVYYVTGSLIIDSDLSGTATFVVEGNVRFESGNVSLDPALDSDYSFIVKGNIESTATASGTLGGVIYTEGNFEVGTDVAIEGAVLCYGNLHGSGDFSIEFPLAVTLEILSWMEL